MILLHGPVFLRVLGKPGTCLPQPNRAFPGGGLRRSQVTGQAKPIRSILPLDQTHAVQIVNPLNYRLSKQPVISALIADYS